MVGKIVKLFHKEFHTVNQAALLLAVFTLGAQLLGLVRERLLAGMLGPGLELDTYVAAFKVPDLVFALAASLVSITILIPFLTERLTNEGKESARQFLSSILSVFSVAIVSIAILVGIFMPFLAHILVPGFPKEHIPELVTIARIMLLSPILLGISNILGTVTQAMRRFTVYALSPIVYNLGIILGIWLLYPSGGVKGLAWGVVFGALLHASIQLVVVGPAGLLPRFTRVIDWSAIKQVVLVSVPRTFTLGFSQLVILVFVAMASKISTGAISIYNFAYVLQSVPFALIGMSYSVAAFPTLVRYVAEGQMDKFTGALIGAIRNIFFWSLPVVVLFVVLRAQIVRVILGTGQFDWSDTRLTAAALALFVLSLWAQGLIQTLVRAYYALGQTKRPLVVNAVGAALTIAGAFLLLRWYDSSPEVAIWLAQIMRVRDVADTKLLMLPLAFSLGTILNLVILWCVFMRKHIPDIWRYVWRLVIQSVLASLVLGVVSFIMLQVSDPWFSNEYALGVLLHGLVAGVSGIVMAILVLYYLGNTEIRSLLRVVHSRFWRVAVVTDEMH